MKFLVPSTLFSTWGAQASELARAMPGDSTVVFPSYSTTLAITVKARPEHIWPWLMQMGYQRGGLYSYDWLDRLFGYLDRPSANLILPEYQHLAIGDEIPIGRGGAFPVTGVEPLRALVLSGNRDGFAWVWQFGLYPIDERRTRLVSRTRASFRPTLSSRLFMKILKPAAFLMTRRMLIGIRQRAERLAAS